MHFAEEFELCSRTDGHSIYTELISNIDDLLSGGSRGTRIVLGHEVSFHREEDILSLCMLYPRTVRW
jgi:hypothetical protein